MRQCYAATMAYGRPDDDAHVACALQGDAEENFWDIPRDRLEKTFMVNIVGMISLAQKAIHHMQPGSSIINVGLHCLCCALSKAEIN